MLLYSLKPGFRAPSRKKNMVPSDKISQKTLNFTLKYALDDFFFAFCHPFKNI